LGWSPSLFDVLRSLKMELFFFWLYFGKFGLNKSVNGPLNFCIGGLKEIEILGFHLLLKDLCFAVIRAFFIWI